MSTGSDAAQRRDDLSAGLLARVQAQATRYGDIVALLSGSLAAAGGTGPQEQRGPLSAVNDAPSVHGTVVGGLGVHDQ